MITVTTEKANNWKMSWLEKWYHIISNENTSSVKDIVLPSSSVNG